MDIELKGIIQYYDNGHKHTDVVVAVDGAAAYEQHRVGVDKKINRVMIVTFLSDRYGVEPGDIAWPQHIKVKDIERKPDNETVGKMDIA